MTNITAEQVREAAIAAGIARIEHADCSICGYQTAYLVRDGSLYFDAGCYCTGGDRAEPRDWSSASEWINMQDPGEFQDNLKRRFGLAGPPTP